VSIERQRSWERNINVIGSVLGKEVSDKLEALVQNDENKITPDEAVSSCELKPFFEKWHQEFDYLDEDIVCGVEEIYQTLKARHLPIHQWLDEAFTIVVRKYHTGSITIRAKCAPYMITILRNWGNYGKGNAGRWQDTCVFSKIERVFQTKLNNHCKQSLYKLIAEHGIFSVYAAMIEYGYDGRNGLEYFLDYVLPKYIYKLKESYNGHEKFYV
jgi:hypothetical protein